MVELHSRPQGSGGEIRDRAVFLTRQTQDPGGAMVLPFAGHIAVSRGAWVFTGRLRRPRVLSSSWTGGRGGAVLPRQDSGLTHRFMESVARQGLP